MAIANSTVAKHLTAESKVEEFVAGKGVVVKWERIRRQNHWFDALYNACVVGHACGVRLVEESVVAAEPAPERPGERVDAATWLYGYRGKY